MAAEGRSGYGAAAMEILVITPELSPISGHGSAATVSAALPKALRGLGHNVTVLSPLYRCVDPARLSLARRLLTLEVSVGGREHRCQLYDGRTAGGVSLLFIGHEELLSSVDSLDEGDDDARAAERIGLFARASAEAIASRDPAVDVVHAHGPIGAAALVAVHARGGARPPSVLTLHDGIDRGELAAEHADRLGVRADGDRVRLLVEGIAAATRVTTVSAALARELCAADDDPLGEALRGLGDRLGGVTNGVDTAVWNPVTDHHIPARFDPMDRDGKARCKSELQRELDLPVRADIPLLGVIGSGDPADGLDVVARCAARLLRNDVQLVALVGSDGELATVLRELSGRWPDRLQVRASDERASHRLLAAADVLIAPGRDGRGGFLPMYAHRYGALPVARRAGIVEDTVVDCDASLTTGNGFVYEVDSADDLLAACRRAVAAFTMRAAFDERAASVMRIDHSWDRSARLYERMFREITA